MAKQAVDDFRPQPSIIHVDPRASAQLRERISKVIERLIEALDAFETPAEDLEEGADDEPGADAEPSLAFTNDLNQTMAARHASCAYATEELEQEHDGREPDSDSEPCLSTGAETWSIQGPHDDSELGHVAVDALERGPRKGDEAPWPI